MTAPVWLLTEFENPYLSMAASGKMNIQSHLPLPNPSFAFAVYFALAQWTKLHSVQNASKPLGEIWRVGVDPREALTGAAHPATDEGTVQYFFRQIGQRFRGACQMQVKIFGIAPWGADAT